MARWQDADSAGADRVTPVEVFFDLVFVFTLTQLTGVLEADLTLAGLGRVLLVFGILWWMFSGYVWLANHVPPRAPSHKLLLFVGMAGFLIAAVGIPPAFDGTGVVFGLGYLVVICVHLLLFTQADVGRAALGWLAVYNLASALLVVVGGFVGGAARTTIWLVALLGQGVLPFLVPRLSWVHGLSSYHLVPGHFVERLGLLVIIALGESVVAIGIGVDVDHLGAGTLIMLVLALALPAALWWTYFTDTTAAERVMAVAGGERRIRLALWIGFAHIPLLLGIVVAAAGIHNAIAHPADPATWPSAVALAGGVAAFLAGVTVDRRVLGVRPVWTRLLTIAGVLVTVPIGGYLNAAAQLAVIVAVVVAMLVPERGRHAELTGARSSELPQGVG